MPGPSFVEIVPPRRYASEFPSTTTPALRADHVELCPAIHIDPGLGVSGDDDVGVQSEFASHAKLDSHRAIIFDNVLRDRGAGPDRDPRMLAGVDSPALVARDLVGSIATPNLKLGTGK